MNLSSNRRLFESVLRGAMIGVVLGAVFLAGYLIRGQMPVTAEENARQTATEFDLLAEVESLLEANYLRELPGDRAMEYAAIRGYLGALNDPYTFFIEPPVAQSESDVLAGQYGGIGVQIARDEEGQIVLHPFREGPATDAGIQDGDILIAINGVDLESGERLDTVDQMLRGEVADGNGVTITVQQPDSEETREYFIEFAVVRVPSVIWRLVDDEAAIGYVQIIRFTSRTPEELRIALVELDEQGALGMILDLRGNSGGLLQESVEVASEFLDSGIVFIEQTRDGETETRAEAGGEGLNKPLVVLVDAGTASAAELVAGAIRDSGRGILIGQQTYGKGSVQLIFRLSDDSSIHITSAEWYTPARTALDGNGLSPDIPMIPADDGRDVEFGEAIRYLNQVLAAVDE